jgi:hypothetical protein
MICQLAALFVCGVASNSGQNISQTANQLILTVKPVLGSDGTVAMLEVREEFAGTTLDGAPLSLKAALSAITVQHIADSLIDLEVKDARGIVPLETSDDRPVTGYDSAFRHWRAKRPTISRVSVSYRIPITPAPEHGPPLGMAAAGKGVAGCGIGFLLLPENTASNVTRIMWDLSSMPAGSVGVVTSGRGDTNVLGPPSEMFKQWVLAGPALSVNLDRPSGFHAYLVGTPPFEGRQMLEFGDRSYSALGAWFRYLGLPDYNLLVRAINVPSFGTGAAGEGRGGSLINVGPVYWPGQDDAYFRSTIFHEMTHQWVGLIQGRASWFEEGLTVYVTATLPCEAHLSTPEECAHDLNRNLRNYYSSEARNWSQKQIDNAPFKNEAAREVPYARGALYFANLNSQLLAKSNGARGLKEALYPLFVARLDGKALSQEDFEEMLRHELGQKAVAEFRVAMIDGTEEIVPLSGAFGPCLERVSVTNELKDGRAAVRGYEWVPIIDGAPASCKEP